jgi:hypothetical protein
MQGGEAVMWVTVIVEGEYRVSLDSSVEKSQSVKSSCG